MAKKREKASESWIVQHLTPIVGRKVVEVRPLTSRELSDFGWEGWDSDVACIIVFDNGKCIVPMADPEGNGPGFPDLGEMEVVSTSQLR